MRYCAILVVAVMLAGCSISRDYSSANRVTLQFRDSSLKECYLLSIHDEALIISDVDPAGLRAETLEAHTMILPFRSVGHIYKQNVGTFSGTLLPSLFDIFSSQRAFRVNAFGNNISAIYDAAQYSFDYFTSKTFSEFELSNARDVELLRTDVAQFPGGWLAPRMK
jgi:hypothetical protein